MVLCLEPLEERSIPAVLLASRTLVVAGTAGADDAAVYGSGNAIAVALNGATRRFAARSVDRVVFSLGAGNDFAVNQTSLPAWFQGGGGDDVLIGGNGRDYIDGNAGRDTLYDLLGQNVLQARDGLVDRVFGNAVSRVVSDVFDVAATFFADDRRPGAGSIVLEGGVLYVTPADANSSVLVTRDGDDYLVVYDFGSGRQTFRAPVVSTRLLAYFGGRGDDRLRVETRLETVAYGGLDGRDVLIGGRARNLLKGGAGDDVVVGRTTDDVLFGDGGIDLLVGRRGTRFRGDLLDTTIVP